MKKLYVGNLPYQTDDNELRSLFEAHGQVLSASVVMDRETGRSRGFGFVEMDGDIDAVIEAMNGADCGGRSLVVNEARPRTDRPRGGGGFGGGGGGYNRGGGGGGRGGGW